MTSHLLENKEDELDCVNPAKSNCPEKVQSPSGKNLNPFYAQKQKQAPIIIIPYSDRPPTPEPSRSTIIDSPDLALHLKDKAHARIKNNGLLKRLSGFAGDTKSENKSKNYSNEKNSNAFFSMGVAHSSDQLPVRDWKDISTQRSQIMKASPKDKAAPIEIIDDAIAHENYQSKCKILGIIGPNIIEMPQINKSHGHVVTMGYGIKKTMQQPRIDTISAKANPTKLGCCVSQRQDCCRVI
jgi:hypothetical protein